MFVFIAVLAVAVLSQIGFQIWTRWCATAFGKELTVSGWVIWEIAKALGWVFLNSESRLDRDIASISGNSETL